MEVSHSAVIVDVKSLCPLGPNQYVSEATMLGFPVGKWPLAILLRAEDGTAQRLEHAGRDLDVGGELVACHYKGRSARAELVTLLVYND